MSYKLHSFLTEDWIKQALKEDIGNGDITTDSIAKPGQILTAKLNSRKEGIVCGIDAFRICFQSLNPHVSFEILLNDGDKVQAGQDIAIISGDAAAILTGERTALNFIQRMSAIATLTNKYQEAIKPYKAKITDTRKTTPNFRIFEKYAVKVGGGSPHRFGLSDAVMIKDNHISLAGNIKNAVNLVRKNIGHTVKIEVEAENLDQVNEALEAKADIIMLDNMAIEDMKRAVEIIQDRAIVEASGNVTLENVNQIASTGVDLISTSAVTAKAGIIDFGLDID